MAFHDVAFDGEHYRVFIPGIGSPTINFAGKPVQQFQEGWNPHRVSGAFAPIYLLELRHESGAASIWWLDDGLNHVSTSAERIGAALEPALMLSAGAILDRIWRELFQDQYIVLSRQVVHFLQLSAVSRLDILNFWKSRASRVTHLCNLSQPQSEWTYPATDAIGIKLDRSALALALDFQGLIGQFVAAGEVTVPSIFTNADTASRHSVCLDTFRFLYRMTDPACGKVFYLALSGHHCVIACIVVPQRDFDLVICADDRQRDHTFGMIFNNAREEILEHLCIFGEDIAEYFNSTPMQTANVQRGEARHMGHMLWNELTGLMKLVDTVPQDRLPINFIPNASAAGEMYGPIDRIFPEFRGKINRDLPDTPSFVRHVYRNAILVFRSTSLIVTQNLRDHVAIYVESLSELDQDRRLATVARQDEMHMLVLGLRVENRTLVDLCDFYVRIVELVLRLLGPVAIVIDGHNASSMASDRLVESNQEWRASTRPIDVERAVVDCIRGRLSGHPVMIIDLIGRPMEAAVFWIRRARFFVAPWGTGMAKYSWLCNKPGYVVTTPWNVKNRPDIAIYDEPLNQDAAKLTWAAPGVVVPQPDAPILIEVLDWARSSYENFSVNYDLLLDDVAGFIATVSQ